MSSWHLSPLHWSGILLPDQRQQLLCSKDIAVERQLLALEVTASPVATSHPTDGTLRDRFVRRRIHAGPFEMDELAMEHDDRPGHLNAGLRDQGPPMLLT